MKSAFSGFWDLPSPNRTVTLVAVLLIALPTQAEISFRNDVMAVLSKAGCNAGTCHGNKNGKGGFKLSLRGQDPEQDYLMLTRDFFGRRTNPVDPEGSLVLLKPTTELPHEGGRRFHKASPEYEILSRWMAEGMRNDLESAPKLETIRVEPGEKVLIEPEKEVQLRVTAQFANGVSRDITRLAVFEPANSLAQVSVDGLVQRLGAGESTVLVRYLHCQEPVRLAFVPARPGWNWSQPPVHNDIDTAIFTKLRTLRIQPAELCSDEVFVRRAYLDLLGILPTPQEAQSFLSAARATPASRTAQREKLIETLLERPEFADFWALKWADLLRVEAHSLDQKGVQNFHHWIRKSIADNKPLDQFVRELLTARGSTYANPAANYYRPQRDPLARGRAAAQVFLGTRLQCAECHNHPSDRWTQDDYYDWAGLFAGVSYKVLENKRDISTDEHEWKGEQVVYLRRGAAVLNPRTGRSAQGRFLGSPAATPDLASPGDALEALANWLTSPENIWFARVQANRIWFQLFGRGLVDPPDDFRATNPASHPELLDRLARDLAAHRFDARYLIRLLMSSRTYQLAAEPDETNAADEINFSHRLTRRLEAEQLLDCQSQVLGVPLQFPQHPAGLRAAEIPGVRPEAKGQRRSNKLDQFLEVFGKPPRLLTTDNERSCECNMGQAFQMISGATVNELLSAKENRITRLLASGAPPRQILDELFWTALTRAPRPEEAARLLAQLEGAGDRRAELEDIVWGLLNSKEFLFRP